MWFKKASARRQAIREDVAEATSLGRSGAGRRQGPDNSREGTGSGTGQLTAPIVLAGLVFFIVAVVVQFWPGEPLPYRVGEVAPTDLLAPAEFSLVNPEKTEQMRDAARATSPPVLVGDQDVFNHIHNQLSALKADVAGTKGVAQVAPEVVARFPGLNDAAVQWIQAIDPNSYETTVRTFLNRGLAYLPLVSQQDGDELKLKHPSEVKLTLTDSIEGISGRMSSASVVYVVGDTEDEGEVRHAVSDEFPQSLVAPITAYIMSMREPTYHFSAKLSAALAERNASQIRSIEPPIRAGEVIVYRGQQITPQLYLALEAAQNAYAHEIQKNHPWSVWLSRLGRLLVVLLLTGGGVIYVSRLARVNRTPRQAWAVCGLLLAMLVLARMGVAVAPQKVYLLGLPPTLLAAIILVIGYNQRFALGLAGLHGLLVTITLGQGIDFFLPMMAGVAAFSFGLGEIRTRGKLIEVGAVASAAIFATVWAIGLARLAGGGGVEWSSWVQSTDLQGVRLASLYAAGAGVVAAMIAMAVLPSIERTFHMTTAMTLLELCDANKPLLQRLVQEAAGTFNHSLAVGTLAEAAGNAIGANGLLCRVGAYYHDVGKLSKPQYFIENQRPGGPNRHDKLSPAMSLLIIVGHVKDGIELAREYGLPWVVHQFIAQHHGTTLVEYFYHAARKRAQEGAAGGGAGTGAAVSDTEFRYPGPKPQTPEAAIVMICDGCESAVRAIEEPTAGRIEAAVHNMIIKRLMDGQFAECDLTLRDLSVIEETLVRALAAMHHGRVQYPASPSETVLSDDAPISQPA